MGLKLLDYGLFGCGKTNFAATMAEVCDIGVIDTESRWQYYTDPHPTVKPKRPSDEAVKRGVPPLIYANPRRLRQDIAWLPKSEHVIWLVQTMDPTEAWECRKIWGTDPSIGGQVCDSASVIWDMLQDSRETHSANGKELGGLSWAPVKRVDRRMTYTILEVGQHFIANCHKQEIMNKEMQVTGSRPWAEKRMAHWFDLVLQFAFGSEDAAPKARIEEEKILGGMGGALKKGTVLAAPTFKQILTLAGGERKVLTDVLPQSTIDERTQQLVNQVAAMPPIPGVDSPTGGQQ
jgi:hypothetical protein